MPISQKCQYGLRAIFELAKHEGPGPLKIAEIARRQLILLRFLEVTRSDPGAFPLEHLAVKGLSALGAARL